MLHLQAQFLRCLAVLRASAAHSTAKGTKPRHAYQSCHASLLQDRATAQLAVHLCPWLWVLQQVELTLHCQHQMLVNSMQVLQSMPVIAAPPRAIQAAPAPAPWPASPEEEALLVVPALLELLPLQPAKLAVYKLFAEQVRPHHTIPYHTIPYHTIPYHTIPYAYMCVCLEWMAISYE